MADRDDLRLNALDRYRKTSRQLALEVHSHCEVPAGCGGVVLRWRRPDAPVGLLLWCFVSGKSEGPFLDGALVAEQRVTVAPGEHVLSFVVERPGAAGFLLARVDLEPEIDSAVETQLLSGHNARFRAATSAPSGDWQLPGFDDAAFVPLVERPVPKPKGAELWRWEMLDEEAGHLGLPQPAARAWVRCAFRVGVEGFA